MSKDAGKPPVREPSADSATEESHVDRLLRLSRESTSRRGEREEDRKAHIARARGWTREDLYERGSWKPD